jgi:hypothetical protein
VTQLDPADRPDLPDLPVPDPPEEIRRLADERADARRERDWATADRLRLEIEAAGWKVVDHGTDVELVPARPPDVVEGERVLYGSSASVPSRLEEAPTVPASVVLVVSDAAPDLARLRGAVPPETQLVAVADAPGQQVADALSRLDEEEVELVWTSSTLGRAASLNAALRRSAGDVVVVVDARIIAEGDFVTPLVEALRDPAVATAGPWGLRSADLRRWELAGPGPVDAVDGGCQAFRRSDYVERGPFDERFRTGRYLDVWWSLVLRDDGEAAAPRAALAIADLPVTRGVEEDIEAGGARERDRLERRDFYRLIDRFGSRRDLLLEPAAARRR